MDKKHNLTTPIFEPLLPAEEVPQQEQNKSAWIRFIVGFKYAFRGIWYALRTQRNARVHVAIALLAILIGLLLHISTLEFALLVVMISVVFIAEMFNTAIELCVDLASPGYHPLAKFAKDVAAGAVLLSALLAIVVGLLIFAPHLWPLIRPFF
ncbi:MAG TPA: diacylglycerol kinase family protein [Ktedonobacteraceae bacterium]|jgi:diacylglycerol kinase|nr:diacylglycerol kinase family protein [Ktedonobacteraceae bacterium]